MEVFPSTAYETLGFEVIRGQLLARSDHELALDLIAREDAAVALDEQLSRLEHVAEYQSLIRFDDPLHLSGLQDMRPIISDLAAEGAYVEGDRLRIVADLLDSASRATTYFQTRSEKYPLLSGVASRHMTSAPACDAVAGQIYVQIDPRGEVVDHASPKLRHLRRSFLQTESRLRSSLGDEMNKAISEGWATDARPTVRGGRMVIPVRADAKRRVGGFVHDVSATGQTIFVEPATCLALNNELRLLKSEERQEVVRILRNLSSQVRVQRDAILLAMHMLAELEVIRIKAALANELGGVVPTIANNAPISIRSGLNPELLLKGNRVVIPLDLQLLDSERTLLITGPNAGGKTVVLKTVGLFALMLSHGIPIPVDASSEFPYVHRLMIDIGDDQSIEQDMSTYTAHVSRLGKMVEIADAQTLVLIDEAGTGTDPREGAAIAQAALESLQESRAMTLVTTHQTALKVFAHETEGIANGSMGVETETLSPTYRFHAGIPGASFGLEIAQRSGLPDTVIKRARELVGETTAAVEELLATYSQKIDELKRSQSELVAGRAEAEKQRAKYERMHSELAAKRKALTAEAQRKAQSILDEANARIEKTVRVIRESEAARDTTLEARRDLESYRDQVDHSVNEYDAETRAKEPREAAPAPIEIGDMVVVGDGSSAAEVMSIHGDKAEVAVNAVRMRVSLGQLRKVGGPGRQSVQVRRVADPAGLYAPDLSTRIDVRGERVDEAIWKVTKLVDEATAAGLVSVEVLHGKGTGALRTSIREYLTSRDDVSGVDDAAIEAGGAGISVVHLRRQ